MAYLEDFADHKLVDSITPSVASAWSWDAWRQQEIDRLLDCLMVVEAALAVQGRVVSKDQHEQREDKRIARRLKNHYISTLGRWGDGFDAAYALKQGPSDEQRVRGAQVLWAELIADDIAKIHKRCGEYAIMALKRGERELGNKVVSRYQNEIKGLLRVQ